MSNERHADMEVLAATARCAADKLGVIVLLSYTTDDQEVYPVKLTLTCCDDESLKKVKKFKRPYDAFSWLIKEMT